MNCVPSIAVIPTVGIRSNEIIEIREFVSDNTDIDSTLENINFDFPIVYSF